MLLCVGVHHKKTPKFDEVHEKTGKVLISAICLNSGYTSRVMVQSVLIHSLGITIFIALVSRLIVSVVR